MLSDHTSFLILAYHRQHSPKIFPYRQVLELVASGYENDYFLCSEPFRISVIGDQKPTLEGPPSTCKNVNPMGTGRTTRILLLVLRQRTIFGEEPGCVRF
jgi:hypothetical protein